MTGEGRERWLRSETVEVVCRETNFFPQQDENRLTWFFFSIPSSVCFCPASSQKQG